MQFENLRIWKFGNKATQKILRMLFVILLLSTFTSCVKYSPDCELVIRPRVYPQQSTRPGGEAGYLVRVYAFYIPEGDMDINNDTSKWAPASYAEAAAGVIRHTETGAERVYGLMGEQGDDTYIHLTVSNSPVVLVAVDQINKFYAYRAFEYKPPLRQSITMTLQFQIWRPNTTYPDVKFTDSYWTVVNGKAEEEREESTANSLSTFK
jgi:hypothetical protein